MSEHDWIIDVLDDLENYAIKNGLTQIAKDIVRKKGIARWEIRSIAPQKSGYPIVSEKVDDNILSFSPRLRPH